jgi:hypothetical protein
MATSKEWREPIGYQIDEQNEETRVRDGRIVMSNGTSKTRIHDIDCGLRRSNPFACMRTVVIGGYGNCGARICRALAADPGIQVIAAGRTPDPSGLPNTVQSAKLDCQSPDFASDLGRLSPGIVIHCAGPFQGRDYRVAKAAMAMRAHYIDPC